MNRNQIEAKCANSVARRGGWGRATAVTVLNLFPGERGRERVDKYSSEIGGYVEVRSGKRVPKAYYWKAWSHCRYVPARCVVMLIDPRRDGPTGVEANAVFAT